MPQKASKARRRKKKLKQGLIDPNTPEHNRSPEQHGAGGKKSRQSNSWFVNFMKKSNRKQERRGRSKPKPQGGGDGGDGRDLFALPAKKKRKKKHTRGRSLDPSSYKNGEDKGKETDSLKRRPGESNREYNLRLKKENQQAILEENRSHSASKTKLRRKQFLSEQKQRKKRKRTHADSSDEEGMYESVKFGDRNERPPDLNKRHKYQGGGDRRVVTLVDTGAEGRRYGGHGVSADGGTKAGRAYKLSQMELLQARISSAYKHSQSPTL